MAPKALQLLLLSLVLAPASATDKELVAQLKALKQEIQDNNAQMNELQAQEGRIRRLAKRRLRDDHEPSIYGQTLTTRPYTAAESLAGALDHMWLLLSGFLVMFMQAGFAMLEAGTCRRKFVQNILLKNLTDVCIGTLGWWSFGWSFALSGGIAENKFIGGTQFLGHHFAVSYEDGQIEPTSTTAMWFFQWCFASAAATIVSGGVAERVKFPGYCLYSFLLTSCIYPVVVAWTWGGGFLAQTGNVGYMDFAGSGIVHMTGGVGALVGAAIAGPRTNRFKTGRMQWEPPLEQGDEFAPHSETLIEVGTAILFFGWFGFNMGSILAMSSVDLALLAGHIAMTTTISGVVGGLVTYCLYYALFRQQSLGAFCNGVLAGLVSITAGCSTVSNGSSIVIGIFGALIYQGSSSLLKFVKIDDPLDAFPIHGACGAWGVMAAALFDWGAGFDYVHGWNGFSCYLNDPDDSSSGCMSGVGWELVGINLAEVLVICLWVGVLSAIVFLLLKLVGLLVASPEEQEVGFDEAKHSPGKAYDFGQRNEQSNQQEGNAA